MSIDTSQNGLKQLRDNIVSYDRNGDVWQLEIDYHGMLALIDALEEARAALNWIAHTSLEDSLGNVLKPLDGREYQSRARTFLNKFPADEPPVGGQSNAAPIKGDNNEKTFVSDNAPRRAWLKPS